MPVFKDDEDREYFLERLVKVLDDADIVLHHFALLDNHYHLVLHVGASDLPGAMARLGTSYSLRFNERHDRVGHVFQNRYGLRVPYTKRHLYELDRYVVLNPVRAGVVDGLDALESYPWASYGATVGSHRIPFVQRTAVLSRYGLLGSDAVANYRSWVQAGLRRSLEDERSVMSGLERQSLRLAEMPESLAVDPACAEEVESERPRRIKDHGIDARTTQRLLGTLITRVCEHMQTDIGRVRGSCRIRAAVQARALIAFLGVRILGVSQAGIARELHVSRSAIVGLLRTADALVEEPPFSRLAATLTSELLEARDLAFAYEEPSEGSSNAVGDRPSHRDGIYAMAKARFPVVA